MDLAPPRRSLRLRRPRRALALALLGGLALCLAGVSSRARLERADLVVNNGAEVATLDPAAITGVPEGRVAAALFEGLTVKHPRTLEPLPGMARSWTVSDDGRDYAFTIREGARWTDGSPVTARDFEASWERLLNPATAARYAYLLWCVEGARAYTGLPEDRLVAGDPREPVWVREVGGGRVRVGASGFLLDDVPGDRVPAGLLEPGDAFEAGDAFLAFRPSSTAIGAPGERFHLPFAGTVTAVPPELPASAGELAADPYEEGWLLEAEPAPGALEAARGAGALLSAARFRATRAWPERVGIEAAGDVLRVRLASPTPYFLNLTSFHPLFPVHVRSIEEAQERWPDAWRTRWLRPENLVTNGPYVVRERRINDRIRLVKNPGYWDADRVAMGSIDVLAVEHYGTMLNLYLTGEVDWIDRVPPDLVPRLLPREDFRPEPYLGTYFYRVNVRRPPFDDRRVRRALALAIDRRAICERVLKAGQMPSWSAVPPGLPGYERAKMDHAPLGTGPAGYGEALAADAAEARALLAEAGFGPGGKPFPAIAIHYNTSAAHRDVAEVVADGWSRLLGIEAGLQNQEWKVYLETQHQLGYDVSRSVWIGDYLDPNTFLDVFVSGGENNRTGWGDERYDALIAAARTEPDGGRRLALLHEAEALLLRELPILPIYVYVTQNLVKPRLGGFYGNLQDEHSPKFWYWMDDAELAAKRAADGGELERVDAGGPPEGLYAPAARGRPEDRRRR